MDSKKTLILTIAAIAFNAGMAAAGVFPLDGTKHDLSSAVTKSYSAKVPAQGGTTEICIFCHTPHGGNTEAPLWNRAASAATYATYTSDVLAGLGGGAGYWAAEDPKTGTPHSKTRICLSCHDGTIALGSVVNMPNVIPSMYTEIQMSGNSTIQQNAPGYIGIDLRDDHPVAIKHDRSKDLELVAGASVGGGVRLYKDNGAGVAAVDNADGNYVECTSCHNPHDNQYGNFLVASNTASAVCKQCHTKTGFEPSSIHFTATDFYSPPDGKGGSLSSNTQVSGVQCMNCHFPHKAGIIDVSQLPSANPNLIANPKAGYYLLAYQEEMTCFNNTNRWGQGVTVCHGSSAPPNRNIQSAENTAPSGRRHYTQDGSMIGRHEATEGQSPGWIGSSLGNWHVECADCHNPHTAGNTSHTTSPPVPVVGPILPVLTSASALYGTGGVQVTSAPTWAGGQGSYSYLEPIGVVSTAAPGVSYEYQICLKCHSEFAWRGVTVPNSPSFLPAAVMTDQAKEFSTAAFGSANQSYHPVMGVGINAQGTLNAPWAANKGNQTMYCSDCHNNSAAPPQGPHGSGNKFILAKPFDDTATAKGTYQSIFDLCFTCHDSNTYLTGGGAGTGFKTTLNTNLHTMHYTNSTNGVSNFGYKCVNCHIRVPHGWNARRAMVIIAGDAPGSVYQLATGPSITGLVGGVLPAPGNYADGLANKNANCMTVNGCHQ